MSTEPTNPPRLSPLTTMESPFAKLEATVSLGASPAHTYGAASLQTYANGQVAFNTHSSADGFLAYVNQFEQTSFRVKDAQVKWWQYSPNFDDWQNNFGCDSVEVFYHAGHGGTDSSSGAYGAPLGAVWDGRTDLNSTLMSLADQRLRYLFLATCEGCMVFPPNNPIRTWNVPNHGFRMLFGATGNIFDDANYGTRFWNHWQGGASFSQAWQDALLDAGSQQQPSSTACGATADEAKSRLFNERYFTNSPVARDWYWWRWVGNAPSLTTGLSFEVPKHLQFARVKPLHPRSTSIVALHRLGLDAAAQIPDGPLENRRWVTPAGHFAVLPGGGVVAEYRPCAQNRSTVTEKQAAEVAAQAAGGVAGLHLMAVLPAYHSGGQQGGNAASAPEVFEHIVIHRQEIAGLPIITPGVGELRTHVDGSGKVRRVVDMRVDVVDVRDHGPWPTSVPTPEGKAEKLHTLKSTDDVMKALQRASLADCATRQAGDKETVCHILPGSVIIGYSLQGTDLVPVARATVEFGKGRYRMLEAVEVALIG